MSALIIPRAPQEQGAPALLAASVGSLAGKSVLIVGDVMLDVYLSGDAERISPEAPVPVVLVEGEKHLLGGAGNVARNIVSLGGKARLVGVCGPDEAGQNLSRLLAGEGIQADLLDAERPTTTKTRIVARRQQMLRIDREDPRTHDFHLTKQVLDAVAAALPECGAVVVSDYGKGLVTRDFMESLEGLNRALPAPVPVLVDPKPQNAGRYVGATLMTPNAKETSETAGLPTRTKIEILAAGRAVMRRVGCPQLLVTLGPDGMAMFLSPDEVLHIPTTARKVFDVTGAGDTVIAATALGLAAGVDLVTAAVLANHAAGIVVGEVGAAVVTAEQLLAEIAAQPRIPVERWV